MRNLWVMSVAGNYGTDVFLLLWEVVWFLIETKSMGEEEKSCIADREIKLICYESELKKGVQNALSFTLPSKSEIITICCVNVL